MPANAGLPPGIHWGYRCARVPRSSRPSSSRPSSPVARRFIRSRRARSTIGPSGTARTRRRLHLHSAPASAASAPATPRPADALLLVPGRGHRPRSPPGDPIPDAFAGRDEPRDSGDVAGRHTQGTRTRRRPGRSAGGSLRPGSPRDAAPRQLPGALVVDASDLVSFVVGTVIAVGDAARGDRVEERTTRHLCGGRERARGPAGRLDPRDLRISVADGGRPGIQHL